MKKIIFKAAFIFIMSLAMISCGNIKTDTETKLNASEVKCPYESYEEELECGKIIYKDSILIFTDYHPEDLNIYDERKTLGDTVVSRIENIIYKDIEIHCDNLGGTGKIGSFTNRIFYHWKTKQVYMMVHNLNKIPELHDGESEFIFCRWLNTIDEVEEYYK